MVVGLDIMISISFLFSYYIYSLVMILGWVDQIGRKGNIVYSSSCSLSLFLSLYTYPKHSHMKKKTQFQKNSRTSFHHKSTTYYLTYKKKDLIRYKPHLISSPSLLPIPVSSPYKYFHHRYLLVPFGSVFLYIQGTYLLGSKLIVSILESKPNGDFLKHLLIRQSNPSEHTCYLK